MIMIKKDKGNVIDVAPTKIAEGVVTMLTMQGNSELRSKTRSLERHTEAIEGSQRNITSARSSIRQYYTSIDEHRERMVTLRRDKKGIEKEIEAIDTTEAIKKVTENIDIARKLKYVESIDVEENTIVVRTRLIFTPIRKESGSREYTRRCIGAFKIKFYLNDQATRIENVLFPRVCRPHWAIDGSTPCQGEHNERFNDAFQGNDLFMLLETVYHFLLSTDDSGAYLPSNDWIYNRNEVYGENSAPVLRKGNYVFVHTDYQQYSAEEHSNYAQIVRCDHGNIYLQFAEPFPYGHDMRGLVPEGTGYRLSATNVKKISKAEYNAKAFTLDGVRNSKPMDVLDSLPDGSTLSDGKELI